jgi:peptidoglycan/xylan/chitin deacetylase (PgdA/CDA1 family)
MPGHMNAGLVLENWLGDFAWMKRMGQWGVLTYTFHPHIIGRGHRMLMLEKLIRTLREQGATFVTMEGALEAYRREYPNGNSLRGR